MRKINLIAYAMVLVGILVATVSFASVPSLVSYQGKLTDSSGVAVPDGSYSMVFSLYNQETAGTQLWTETQMVQVTGGLFTVLLGSTSALPDSAFEGSTWLEISVNSEALSPRTRIVSAGYAFRAKIAESVVNGSIYAESISPGQVVKSINSLKDDVTLAAGSNITITPSGNTLTFSTTSSSEKWNLTGNAGTTAGVNFLGTTDNVPFEIRVRNSRALKLESAWIGSDTYSVNVIGGNKTNSVTAGAIGATIAGGGKEFFDLQSQQYTVYPNKVTDDFGVVGGGLNNQAGDSVGTTSDRPYATVAGGLLNIASGGYATIPGGYNNAALGNWSFAAGNRAKANTQGSFVWADSTTADFSSTGNDQFLVRASGGVGIGNTSPSHALTVQSTNNMTMRLIGSGSAGSNSKFNFGDGDYVYIHEDADDYLTIKASNRIALTGGNVGVGTTSPTEKLQIDSGNLLVRGPQNFAASTEAKLILGDGNNYVKAVWGQGLRFGVFNGVDVLALDNGGNVSVKGNLRILSKANSAIVAEIGEGLDYAEGFDVSDQGEITPGTVLVIDSKNPGKLAVSSMPYDRKVAGIVAGANNLGSGVRLGAGQFDRDVALAGRVYCNVDATKTAVKPGDLLTTSVRPGYAMKVTNHAKAQGAILGKAMQSLAKGETGQILVLVTLQ